MRNVLTLLNRRIVIAILYSAQCAGPGVEDENLHCACTWVF